MKKSRRPHHRLQRQCRRLRSQRLTEPVSPPNGAKAAAVGRREGGGGIKIWNPDHVGGASQKRGGGKEGRDRPRLFAPPSQSLNSYRSKIQEEKKEERKVRALLIGGKLANEGERLVGDPFCSPPSVGRVLFRLLLLFSHYESGRHMQDSPSSKKGPVPTRIHLFCLKRCELEVRVCFGGGASNRCLSSLPQKWSSSIFLKERHSVAALVLS